MAGPAYVSVGTRSQSASAATLSPAKPTLTGASANGILVAVVSAKNNAVITTATSGWTKVDQQNSGASFTAALFIALASAAAPAFSWTGAAACSAQIAYYDCPDGVPDITSPNFTASTGSTNTHTSTALTTGRPNALAVYVDVAANAIGLATPSGWTENSDLGSGTDSGNTVFGSKAVATSGSSSGSISVTGAAAAWVQWQIELREAAAASGVSASKMESGQWLSPGEGVSANKIESGLWLGGENLKASKLEAGLWVTVPAATTWKPKIAVF